MTGAAPAPDDALDALITVFFRRDETADLWDTVFVSGGRRGLDVELAPADLVALTDATVAEIGTTTR